MASVAGVQQAVSTHPVLASGIWRSGRPVSGHLGSSSRGSGGRPSAVHPSGVQPSGVCPRRSGRVRLLPLRRWRWGPRSRWPGDRDHRNRWRPRWLPGRRRLDGRGGQDAGDAADVALVTGRSVADPGRRVGCGPRRPRLPAERPGRPGRRAERPSQVAARWARVQAAARGGCTRRVAGVLGLGARPRRVVVAEPDGRVGGLGGATRGAGGRGVRPQRGPSRRRALPARCRQRCDLRRWVVGLPGLEPGTSSLSGIFAGCVQAARREAARLSVA